MIPITLHIKSLSRVKRQQDYIDTVGLHQQTPVLYGSQLGPVLYGAIGDDGLVSESRTLPDEAAPRMSALPKSGLATIPKKVLKPAPSLVYKTNPYVYKAIKPKTSDSAELRTLTEGLEQVNTNSFVYTTNPYVYTHPMNPVHPTQITPIVPHGFGYSFTVDHESIPAQPKKSNSAEVRTLGEGQLEQVNTYPYVYTANPYVYTHLMNPVHPTQIKPVVPSGLKFPF